ncbi:MAG: hypothetical protein ACR2NM_08915 [Bythopirellula sp.]
MITLSADEGQVITWKGVLTTATPATRTWYKPGGGGLSSSADLALCDGPFGQESAEIADYLARPRDAIYNEKQGN